VALAVLPANSFLQQKIKGKSQITLLPGREWERQLHRRKVAMCQKIEMAVLVVTLMVVGITPCPVVAQVPLDDQLKAQYTMVKMGADTGGAAVVEQGTILVIKKGGILSVPYGDTSVVPTKYQDGVVHSPNNVVMKGLGFGMKKFGKEQTTRLMQVGEKVYPSKIVVNLPKDQVTLSIIACDSCNNVSPTTFYKADVVFQFAHGSLATTSPSQVEDAIAGLLAMDDSPDQGGGQQGGNGDDQQGGNRQGGGGGQAQQQGPPPEPQQIEKGQTPDQVKAAIGQPDKIVNLGAKQIYVYKDIKVTFINGKVSDVQ
jgi:hypothetical protein